MNAPPNNKADLRAHFLIQRKQLSSEKKQSYSERVLQQLSSYLHTNNPDFILMYYALNSEVDTRPFFHAAHANLYAPRMLGDTDMQWLAIDTTTMWKKGSLGVLEPESGQSWQARAKKTMLICPLVSFDRSGNRLGMGKGYFDRWLDKNGQYLSEIVGLAFSCQESAVTIPTEVHDVPLDTIITEQEIITCQTF